MNRDAGPAPVANRNTALVKADETYAEVVQRLKADDGADMRAMGAMFHDDEAGLKRFLAVCFAALAKQTDILQKATPLSLVQAVKDAASLGLEPFTGEGSIIVYGDRAEFRPEWRGYLKRIRNSGEVRDVDVQLVYDMDSFDYHFDNDGGHHLHRPLIPARGEDGKLASRGGYWGAYAYAKMNSGFEELEVMTETDINAIRDRYSKSKGGPWADAWGEMARKTCIRRLAKRLPSAAVQQLLQREAVNDAAMDAQADATRQLTEQVSGLRELAIRGSGSDVAQGVPERPAAADTSGSGTSAQTKEAAPAATDDGGR